MAERSLFFGEKGRNGKGTFIRALERTLGRRHVVRLSSDVILLHKGSTPHPTIRMPLVGARLGYFAEMPDNAAFNLAEIKDLTGGDVFNAHAMRKDDATYTPTAKLLLQTNRMPRADAGDQAFWSRARLVEFPVSFEGREDLSLEAMLCGDDQNEGERSGILNWALEGCRQWRTHKLDAPEKVIADTSAYREREDVVARFMNERTVRTEGTATMAKDLFAECARWCRETHEGCPTNARVFCRELRRLGYADGPPRHGYPTFSGVALVPREARAGEAVEA